MRAAHRHTRLEPHELGQHLRAPDNRNIAGARLNKFWVIRFHRRRNNNHLRLANIRSLMADENFNVILPQPRNIGVVAEI